MMRPVLRPTVILALLAVVETAPGCGGGGDGGDATGGATTAATATARFTNPVVDENFPDPFDLQVRQTY